MSSNYSFKVLYWRKNGQLIIYPRRPADSRFQINYLFFKTEIGLYRLFLTSTALFVFFGESVASIIAESLSSSFISHFYFQQHDRLQELQQSFAETARYTIMTVHNHLNAAFDYLTTTPLLNWLVNKKLFRLMVPFV